MATRFNSKEYAKQRIFNICAKFFPKDQLKINVGGRKGYRLGEGTIALINQSIAIITHAQQSDETVPLSTVNVFRFGTTLQEIFENLGNFQVISQLKTRSRRGYRKELEVVDFDLRKIEIELKKSSNPPVKYQKDEKFIRNAQKYYSKLLNDDKHSTILEDVIKNQDLFIVAGTDGKRFFDSLFRLLNTLTSFSKEKIKLKNQKMRLQGEVKDKNVHFKELEQELPHSKHIMKVQREKSGISQVISEKESLLIDPELSLFLKILVTSLERYTKMIERRESRNLEQREDYLGLILEPTRFQGLNEELWRQIVFIVETHGFELLSGKNWFKFEDPTELRQFMVNKDVLSKFARIRELEQELEKIEIQIQEDPQYSKAQKTIQDFEETEFSLIRLKKEIPEIKKRIASLTRDIETEKEKIAKILH